MNPTNIHNIPPLLANAVIKKPQEESSIQCVSNENQTNTTTTPTTTTTNSVSDDSTAEHPIESTSTDKSPSNDITSFTTMANYLPENTFFYNDKNCYIFPGAEIWWKDSDLESTSSDSSINDDDDDDDIDMEIATIERNEMIGDVETTIAVENLIETTTEHEFNKYLLKRTADTSLDHIEIEANDMNSICAKRLRTTTQPTTVNTPSEFDLEDASVSFDDAPTSSCDSSSSSGSNTTNTSSTSNRSDLLLP